MGYKIQDANKTFKASLGAIRLFDAKNLFPHGCLFVHADDFACAFVHRGEHAKFLGPKPGLYFAKLDLHFHHAGVRRGLGNGFHGVGLSSVKVHLREKNNHIGFLYYLRDSFCSHRPFGQNGFGFGGRNGLSAKKDCRVKPDNDNSRQARQ